MNFDRTDLNGFYINQISNTFKLKPVVEFRTSNADLTFYKYYIRLQYQTKTQRNIQKHSRQKSKQENPLK